MEIQGQYFVVIYATTIYKSNEFQIITPKLKAVFLLEYIYIFAS